MLAQAWGPSSVWKIPPRVWDDGGPARVEFDDGAVRETLRIFLPADATDAAKVHEAGHAIHLAVYPESATWPTLKCEVFAMLGVVRLKMDGAYGPRPEIVRAGELLKQGGIGYLGAMKLAAADDRYDF